MNYSVRRLVGTTLWHGALLVGAIFVSLPVIWMVSASFMTSAELFATKVQLFPSQPQLANYVQVFTKFNFARYLTNSLLVTGSIVLLNVIFCPMVGYSLAKFDFPGKNLLFLFIMSTVMVPFTAILVPLYLIIRTLNWINSYPAMIAPFAMSAFGIFLMRQFLFSIPDDYLAAARIDGASEGRIYWQVVLPLCQPALVTLAIITFIGSWDELIWMLVVTTTDQLRTLPIGLAKFIEAYQTRWDLMMAGAVVAAAPAVLLFLVMQRRFLQGMAGLSGLK